MEIKTNDVVERRAIWNNLFTIIVVLLKLNCIYKFDYIRLICYTSGDTYNRTYKIHEAGENNDIGPLFGPENYGFEFDFKIISGVALRSLE